MGWFTEHDSELQRKETERNRGIADETLPKLTDQALMFLTLSVMFEQSGCEDDALFKELKERSYRWK